MNRSELELKTMGKKASAEYLYNKVPMNDTIVSITKEAGLNPHQVARVCEAANINTYDTLWDMHKNAEFVFDMADQEKIAEILNAQPDSTLLDETTLPVESLKDLLPSTESVDTVFSLEKESSFKKLASIHNKQERTPVSRARLEKLAAKMDYYLKELDLAVVEQKAIKEAALHNLTQMLKSAAIHGEDISSTYVAARIAFPDNVNEVNDIFTKVSSVLKDNNISLTHGYAKNASKITNQNARGDIADVVVNKAHPILKHLDTILECDCLCDDADKARGYLVKKMDAVKETLHKHDLSKE